MNSGHVNSKSGPHPSLHQRSVEVREVQFELRGPCRGIPEDEATPFFDPPIPIWVEWPADNRDECGLSYKVTKRSVRVVHARLRQMGYAAPPGVPMVCEHMGRLIE